jgi:hypothetical protein
VRAATVIVGAFAVSSCLIALALVLTSGNSNTTSSSARKPSRTDTAKAKAAGGIGSSSAPVSGPVQCNVEVTVEGGSCFLGKKVLAVYKETGSTSVTALDPESGEEVSFKCNGTAPTVCTSRNGVSVYLAPPGE